MKFKWFLILAISMFAFTGLSATADLTENSDVVLSYDNDVGDLEVLLVAQNVDLLEVKTQRVEAPFVKIEYANRNYGYSESNQTNVLELVKPPDIQNQVSGGRQLYAIPNRCARDGLMCT